MANILNITTNKALKQNLMITNSHFISMNTIYKLIIELLIYARALEASIKPQSENVSRI